MSTMESSNMFQCKIISANFVSVREWLTKGKEKNKYIVEFSLYNGVWKMEKL